MGTTAAATIMIRTAAAAEKGPAAATLEAAEDRREQSGRDESEAAADFSFLRGGDDRAETSSFLLPPLSDPLPPPRGGSGGRALARSAPPLPGELFAPESGARRGGREGPERSRRRRRGSSGGGAGTQQLPPASSPLLKAVTVELPLRLEREGGGDPRAATSSLGSGAEFPGRIAALRGGQRSRLGLSASVPIALPFRMDGSDASSSPSLTAAVSSHVGTRGRVGHAASTVELRYRRQWQHQRRQQQRGGTTTWTAGVTLAEKPSFHVGAAAAATTTTMPSTRRKGARVLAPAGSWSARLSVPAPSPWRSWEGHPAPTSVKGPRGGAAWSGIEWLRRNMSCALGWSRELGPLGTIRSAVRLALPPAGKRRERDRPIGEAPAAEGKAPGSPPPSPGEEYALGSLGAGALPAVSFLSVSLDGAGAAAAREARGSGRRVANRWGASAAWRPDGGPGAAGPGAPGGLKSWLWPRISLSLSPAAAAVPELVLGLIRPRSSWSDRRRAGVVEDDDDRACHLSGWYDLRDASWSWSASLSRKLRPAADGDRGDSDDIGGHQFSVGWTRASRWSWTFLLSWRIGGSITVRVPVAVSTVMDPLWYPLQVLVGTLVAGLVHDVASGLILGTTKATAEGGDGDASCANGSDGASARASRLKARRTAENQQLLMRRTAENRMKAERDKKEGGGEGYGGGGLVVRRAVYFTDRESWDVTVPVQFWVRDSVLDIGPATKKDLLGFYDLSYRVAVETKAPDPAPAGGGISSWISRLWTGNAATGTDSPRPLPGGNGGRATRFRVVRPQLRIEYSHGGRDHEVVYRDHDEILLPRTQDAIAN